MSPGKSYGGNNPIAPRVLTQLGVEAKIVRGRNGGHWRTARPQWTAMATWLGRGAGAGQGARGVRRAGPPLARAPSGPAPRPTSSGGSARPRAPYAPRSPTSPRSRSGSTAARPAGCCPTTLDPEPDGRAVGGAAAGARPDGDGLEGARLLPRRRTARCSSTPTATPAPPPGGTAGSSAAGCRTPTGSSSLNLLEDVGADARAALDAEADRLTGWLDGHRVSTVYPSIAMKTALGP